MTMHYRRWKFSVLLIALLALMVAHPLSSETTAFSAAYEVLLGSVFLCAILALFQRPQSRLAALLLGIPTVIGTFTSRWAPAWSPLATELFFHSLPVLFLSYTAAVILRSIFVDDNVTADSVNGAFCGYLLIALAFGHLYCLVEAFHPGSFLVNGVVNALPEQQGVRHFRLTYFSLVTLTTVGYGDITPARDGARMLAGIEAVCGQFYVAAIIAELIGLKVSASLREPDASSR
jgi:hypothetical protein